MLCLLKFAKLSMLLWFFLLLYFSLNCVVEEGITLRFKYVQYNMTCIVREICILKSVCCFCFVSGIHACHQRFQYKISSLDWD